MSDVANGGSGPPNANATDEGQGTEITVHQTGIPEAIPPSDANEGWTDSLGNLAELVEA